MKRFSQQFKKQADHVTMRASEKAELKARLVSYMEYHPLPVEMLVKTSLKKSRLQGIASDPFSTFTFNKVYTRSFFGAFAMLLIVGVPFVAERTLPGDVLYPVKVQFNEEVRATLAFSPYAKVEWETQRLERRISEARLLASEGRLTPEAEIAFAEAVQTHTDAAQREIAELRATDKDGAAIAEMAFASALAVQSQVLAVQSDDTTATTSGDYSVVALADVVAKAQSSAESAQVDSSLSYEKLLATVEQESTRVYELFESVKTDASPEEVADIERTLADMERKVSYAISLKNGTPNEVPQGVVAMTMSMAKIGAPVTSDADVSTSSEVAKLSVQSATTTPEASSTSSVVESEEVVMSQTDEQKKVSEEEAVASLRATLTDIQKLLNYLSHIDVRENVALGDLVPVVLTPEEKAREIIQIYDEVHALQAKVALRVIPLRVKAKVTHGQRDVDVKLAKVSALMEKGSLDEARVLVEDARNVVLDLDKMTSNEPVKVEGAPEIAPVMPATTTASSTVTQ